MIRKLISHGTRIIRAGDYSKILDMMMELEEAGYNDPGLVIDALNGGNLYVSAGKSRDAQRYPILSFSSTDDIVKLLEKEMYNIRIKENV